MRVTGTLADLSAFNDFFITFVDPCPSFPLTINEPSPFPFFSYHYVIDDPELIFNWTMADIATQDSQDVYCGERLLQFTKNTGIALDSAVFEDERLEGFDNQFKVL